MKKNPATHLMSKLIMMVFTIIFLILFGRYLYIQGTGEIQGVSLEEWADEKRTNSHTIDAERGKIFDRNGMLLAYDRPTYRLYAIIEEEYSRGLPEPKHVTEPKKAAEQLAPLLHMQTEKILKQLNKDGPFQVEFGAEGRFLSLDLKQKIEELDIPGIYFMNEPKRYYPNGLFASHLIGFTQKKDEKINGIMGVEESMNDSLRGEGGYISYKRDKFNVKLLDPEQVMKKPENGNNLYLTLDQKIQTFLEDAMTYVEKQYKPERMMAVVMDPKTGEVVAMSNRPSFNPNERSGINNWYNDVISYPFEPGSTMKIFTWSAAIEAGEYDGDETYQSGSFRINENNRAIHDHNWGGWGEITFDEGFQRSSNVAAAKLVWDKIGTEKYLDYLKDFHLDQKTGIDLPGEQAGEILYRWPIEKVTASFGQGSTFTPIQLMTAASAVANDGKMMKPYAISKVEDPDTEEIIKKNEPKVIGEPISKETSKKVRDLLGKVITGENGTGRNYKLNDFSVAGKTGTAQIPDATNGGYMTGKENYIFSFLGMAPKNDPELMMYVAVKQPDLSEKEFGSESVSYIFNTVMENSLHYMNIRPDKKSEFKKIKPITLNHMKGKSVSKTVAKLKEEKLDPIVIGDGEKVKATLPQGKLSVLPNEKIFLYTGGAVDMPDISDWSLRDVLKFGDLLQMNVETVGNGYVQKQSIPPGAEISQGKYLVVELEAPNSPEQSERREDDITYERDMHQPEQ